MKLYLLRHGKADWPDWTGTDDERPLTAEGVSEMRVVALALKRMKLSSPLPRAHRTAEIAAEALGLAAETHMGLQPGFGREECDTIVAEHAGSDVMLVGHEPDLGEVIRGLTGGRVKMSKAAVAAIEIDDELAASRLLWFFTAKMLVRLYR